MQFIRFLFTARRAFIILVVASFVVTIGYLSWHHRYREPVRLQQRGAEELRKLHQGADQAIREYKGPTVAPPKAKEGQQ